MDKPSSCWQAALEAAPVAICVIEDGWIRFANRACAELWGAASAEALVACALKDLLAVGSEVPVPPAPNGKGSPAVCRAQIVRLDGEPREVEIALASFTAPPPRQVGGKSSAAPLVLVQMVLRDITETLREREQLERSRRELRDLSANLVDAREQERQHIARELHDELGQQLTALKIGLTHLAPSQKAGREDRVMGLIERLDETFESLRRIATDLRPPMLDDLGLNAAIEWLGLETARRLNIEVDLNFADTTPPLEDMASIAIYRMVQEALTNVARHAHASKVWIETRCEGGQFSISVRDNGVGFASEAVGRQGSHGLTGIRERAAILGGAIEIGNAPGGGGCITVRLPLERSAAPPEAPTPAAPSQPPARPAWALRSPEAVLHELQVHQIEVEMQNEELRRTQIELAAVRDRYVHLYDYAPVGYLTLNRDGLVIEANQTGARLLGEKRSALIHRRLARFVAPEDGDRWHRYLLRALQQDGPQPVELTLQPRGAPAFQAQIDGLRLVPVGAETTLRITLTDITERKRAEIDRRIATHTIESREAERRRVARALHEELGQELSALKMDLACLPSAPPGPVHDQRLADIQTVLDTAVATVRRIATDLRPLLLDDLGLTAAIDWLARDLAQRSGLRITLELEECKPPLNESMSVAVYRMTQEALVQVARGLSSSQIHIGLRHPPGELVLCLQDNGPDQRALYEELPFDLTDLRQQVHLLRGRLDADSRPGGRRRIAIHLPLLRSTDHLIPSPLNKEPA